MIDIQVLKGCAVRGTKGQGRIESISLPWVRIQWANGEMAEVDSQAYRRGADVVFEDFEILTLDKGWQSLGSLVGKKSKQKQLIVDLEAIVGDEGAGKVATLESVSTKNEDTMAAFKSFTLRKRTPEGVQSVVVESAEHLRSLFEAAENEPDSELTFFSQNLGQVGNALRGLIEYEDSDGNVLAEHYVLTEAAKHNPFKKWAKIGFGPYTGKNDKARKWKCKCSNYTCKCVGIGSNSDAGTKIVKIDRGYKKAYNRTYKPWRAAKEPYKPSRA